MKSNSITLRSQIDAVMPAMRAAAARLAQNLEAAYPLYLRCLHGMVRASVPLLVCAEGESWRLAAAGDPVAAALAKYFARHAKEESGHDRWLCSDAEALGLNAQQDLVAPIPISQIATAVGQQYYWIQHHHPISLMGYIAVVEGYPPTARQLENWQRQTGFPESAFSTLRKHGAIDPHHRRDADELLDSLELSPALVAMLTKSAIHTVLNVVLLVEEIARVTELRLAASAAATAPGTPATPARERVA